jgi:L-2-hydroxyglutarate oxidase LhgO
MEQPDVVDVAIIGAGVVGLAIARELAASGLVTVVVERNRGYGMETSSRNSGVVHSGIYYPKDSLKARLCVGGRALLYDYCRDRGIAHRRCGKLIVAQQGQIDALRELQARGVANGVTDLEWLDGRQASALEPAVRCAAALLSPSTGIVDPHELMTSLLADVEAHDGVLALDSRVERLRMTGDCIELAVTNGTDPGQLTARNVINAAGLHAVELTRRIEGYPKERVPRTYLAKGNYFSCSGRPFRRLVYPMPNDAGLGIHATLDLDGSVRFGPDVEWVEDTDLAVDPKRAVGFYQSIREYWPELPDGALQPAYSGMRPKIVGPGEPAADFAIEGPRDHGVPGLINLLGIESPGLTAALAIGRHVRTQITS